MNPLPALLLTVFLCAPLTQPAQAAPTVLTAADGAQVFADYSPAAPAAPGNATAKAPLIVAFHQAGSNRSEYAPLLPRLNQAGFNVLTIDQRSGGNAFGGKNQTVTALGKSTAYAAALPDMEAALAWAKTQAAGAPVIVWGSSYSAALVFVLAAKHPADVQGLLAFSPGEYLGSSSAVRSAAQKLSVPVFMTQSGESKEIDSARRILDALALVPATDKQQFIPRQGGVHGSSTLRTDRNAAGAEENWAAVLGFLGKFKAGK
ncbi:MAG: alpha/beta hydrolase [Burkholderiaceae bacterium]